MGEGVAARHWMMTAVNKPMIGSDFVAAAGEGEVVVAVARCGVRQTDPGYFYDGARANHPLDQINEAFGQAHAHKTARHAALVP